MRCPKDDSPKPSIPHHSLLNLNIHNFLLIIGFIFNLHHLPCCLSSRVVNTSTHDNLVIIPIQL
jgi:hypothetical protein